MITSSPFCYFNNPPEAAANFTKLFREIFGAVTSRGITVERLRVLPPVGFRNVEPRHLQAEIAMRQAAQDGGEVSRFVWYDDRLVDDLVAACGPDLTLVHSYLEGVEQGVPRTSMWVTRATGGLTLQAVRLIDYAEDDPSVIRSSSLHLTPTERDLQAFEGFWADLYHDKSQSYDLGQMVAIHRS